MFRILTGEDVVGDDERSVARREQLRDEHFDQRRLAGAHGPADPDASDAGRASIQQCIVDDVIRVSMAVENRVSFGHRATPFSGCKEAKLRFLVTHGHHVEQRRTA
jgi:hypothetical protein